MTHQNGSKYLRHWFGNRKALRTGTTAFKEAIANVAQPIFVVAQNGEPAVTHTGTMMWGDPVEVAD
ncbi:MAG: hypothetical protein HZB87_00190, partial [Desulfatitalea sp.]|nr:hypothetical protein [Desulfatitalea sp.]